MSDTLVFDIETQNFFTDPDVGWDNFSALRISVVGMYSYAQDKYFCFEESEIEKINELFQSGARIVGFSMNRYDVPVLDCYFKKLGPAGINLWSKDRVDLLEEVEIASGNRVSLSRLAELNLGVKKTRHGSEAIGLYRNGQMEELKEYCINDVQLTKDLYDLYREQGTLLVPDRKSGEVIKVQFKTANALPTLF